MLILGVPRIPDPPPKHEDSGSRGRILRTMRTFVSALVAATLMAAGVVAPVQARRDEGRWVASLPDPSGDSATSDLFRNGVGYVSLGGPAIYRTVDFGQTWTPLKGAGTSTTGTDLSFASPQKGYVEDSSRILRTTDGGATWRPGGRLPAPPNYLAPQVSIDSVEALPGTDKVVVTGWGQARSGDECVARPKHGVWRSNDGGVTWKRRALPYPAATLESEFLDGRSGLLLVSEFRLEEQEGCAQVIRTFRSVVLLTRDGGRTFDEIYSLRFSKGEPVTAVALASEDRIVLGTRDGVIFRSENGGRSFNRVGRAREDGGLPVRGSIDAITFATPKIGYLGTGIGMWRTEDGGRTWRKEESPFVGGDDATSRRGSIAAVGRSRGIAVGRGFVVRRVSE